MKPKPEQVFTTVTGDPLTREAAMALPHNALFRIDGVLYRRIVTSFMTWCVAVLP